MSLWTSYCLFLSINSKHVDDCPGSQFCELHPNHVYLYHSQIQIETKKQQVEADFERLQQELEG